MNETQSEKEPESDDCFDWWCYTEMLPFSLEELGDNAWLTGCPFCGLSWCGENATPEDEAEVEEFFEKNDHE